MEVMLEICGPDKSKHRVQGLEINDDGTKIIYTFYGQAKSMM